MLNILRGRPLFAQYAMTHRCNSRCPSCEYWGKQAEGKELIGDEVSRLADDLWHFGVRVLTVTGGEPFLRDDAPQIIRLFQERGFRVTINTNGTCIDETLMKELSGMKKLHIVVSLDSLDRETYAKIRGIDALERVLTAMSDLKSQTSHEVRAFTTVSSWNLTEVPQILDFCHENGYRLSVYPAMTSTRGRWFTQHDMIAPGEREKVAELFDKLSQLSTLDRTLFGFGEVYGGAASFLRGEPLGECGAGRMFMQISPDGKISACPESAPFCDIRTEDLSEMYRRELWQENVERCSSETPCYIGCTRMLQSIRNSPVRSITEITRKRFLSKMPFRRDGERA